MAFAHYPHACEGSHTLTHTHVFFCFLSLSLFLLSVSVFVFCFFFFLFSGGLGEVRLPFLSSAGHEEPRRTPARARSTPEHDPAARTSIPSRPLRGTLPPLSTPSNHTAPSVSGEAFRSLKSPLAPAGLLECAKVGLNSPTQTPEFQPCFKTFPSDRHFCSLDQED